MRRRGDPRVRQHIVGTHRLVEAQDQDGRIVEAPAFPIRRCLQQTNRGRRERELERRFERATRHARGRRIDADRERRRERQRRRRVWGKDERLRARPIEGAGHRWRQSKPWRRRRRRRRVPRAIIGSEKMIRIWSASASWPSSPVGLALTIRRDGAWAEPLRTPRDRAAAAARLRTMDLARSLDMRLLPGVLTPPADVWPRDHRVRLDDYGTLVAYSSGRCTVERDRHMTKNVIAALAVAAILIGAGCHPATPTVHTPQASTPAPAAPRRRRPCPTACAGCATAQSTAP